MEDSVVGERPGTTELKKGIRAQKKIKCLANNFQKLGGKQ